MPAPTDSHLEDDASGEVWFQKGVTLLDGRKQEREIEEKLRKAMDQSVLVQWQMLLALLLGVSTFWQIDRAAPPLSIGLNIFMVLLFILSAIDNANARAHPSHPGLDRPRAGEGEGAAGKAFGAGLTPPKA